MSIVQLAERAARDEKTSPSRLVDARSQAARLPDLLPIAPTKPLLVMRRRNRPRRNWRSSGAMGPSKAPTN